MNAKLNGLAWIFFGILLVLVSTAGGLDWIPIIDDIPSGLWSLVALACGVWGLVTALRSDH